MVLGKHYPSFANRSDAKDGVKESVYLIKQHIYIRGYEEGKLPFCLNSFPPLCEP